VATLWYGTEKVPTHVIAEKYSNVRFEYYFVGGKIKKVVIAGIKRLTLNHNLLIQISSASLLSIQSIVGTRHRFRKNSVNHTGNGMHVSNPPTTNWLAYSSLKVVAEAVLLFTINSEAGAARNDP